MCCLKLKQSWKGLLKPSLRWGGHAYVQLRVLLDHKHSLQNVTEPKFDLRRPHPMWALVCCWDLATASARVASIEVYLVSMPLLLVAVKDVVRLP